jgi:hypothetical protein
VIVLRKSQVQPFSEWGKEVRAGLEFYGGRPMELRAVLERDGFEVVAGANLREALSRIAAESFDLLLSDFVTASPARPLGPRGATSAGSCPPNPLNTGQDPLIAHATE